MQGCTVWLSAAALLHLHCADLVASEPDVRISICLLAGVMVGGLTTGRMLIAQSAVDSLKMGVSIAIRYSVQRPQFQGKKIAEYVTHQRRLLPALANAYALHISLGYLKQVAFDKTPQMSAAEQGKVVHVTSAGLKAASTWSKMKGLQDCRECCGGQGFLAANKIGPLLTDTNVDVTFEGMGGSRARCISSTKLAHIKWLRHAGDNTVMMQQVAKAFMDDKHWRPDPTPHDLALERLDAQSISHLLSYRSVSCAFGVPMHGFRHCSPQWYCSPSPGE
jgi:Acyl-CoA dehydrogenase, C-terminal domain